MERQRGCCSVKKMVLQKVLMMVSNLGRLREHRTALQLELLKVVELEHRKVLMWEWLMALSTALQKAMHSAQA